MYIKFCMYINFILSIVNINEKIIGWTHLLFFLGFGSVLIYKCILKKIIFFLKLSDLLIIILLLVYTGLMIFFY